MIHLSPSQLDTFKRCRRKWAFGYIDRIERPANAKLEFGTEVHSTLEEYVLTGNWIGADDAIAVAKLGLRDGGLPPPCEEVLVEQEIDLAIEGGKVVGFVDLVLPSPLQVIDYKTTSDLRFAKTEATLREDPQAVIYSKWAIDTFKADAVRCRWLYFAARGKDRPRTPHAFREVKLDWSRAEVETAWRSLLPIFADMIDLKTRCTSAEQVEANDSACSDYGGCPFVHSCSAAKRWSLGGLDSVCRKSGTEVDMPSLMDVIREGQNKGKDKASTNATPATKAPPPAPALPPLVPPKVAVGVNPPAPPALSPAEAAWRKAKAEEAAKAPAVPAPSAPVPEALDMPDGEVTWDKAWLSKLGKARLVAMVGARGGDNSPSMTKPELVDELLGYARAAFAEHDETPAPEPVDMRTDAGPGEAPPAVPSDAELHDNRPEVASGHDIDSTMRHLAEQEGRPTTAQASFVLAVDCYPAKLPEGTMITTLADLTSAARTAMVGQYNVAHWNLLDYRRGEAVLAAVIEKQLADEPFVGVLLCDSRSDEFKACGTVLADRADLVLRG